MKNIFWGNRAIICNSLYSSPNLLLITPSIFMIATQWTITNCDNKEYCNTHKETKAVRIYCSQDMVRVLLEKQFMQHGQETRTIDGNNRGFLQIFCYAVIHPMTARSPSHELAYQRELVTIQIHRVVLTTQLMVTNYYTNYFQLELIAGYHQLAA